MKKWTKWLSVMCVSFMAIATLAACSFIPGFGGSQSEDDNYCTVKFELCTELRTNNIMDQEVEIGSTVSKPIVAVIGENPNNEEVDSWYTDAEYTTKWNFLTDTVTADMTLYAKWIGKFNVNYYLGDNTETPMFTQEFKEGETLVALTELSDGYSSNGFFTSPDYTEEFEFGKPVTKEENIYIHRSEEINFSADMIARRFSAVAAPSGAGSKAGSIEVAGEGEDRYAVANFGYSTASDPFILLKNVTLDITHSQKIRMTFKNMGSAVALKFYFVAWFDDATREYVDEAFFTEAATYTHHYTEDQMNMTAEDEWLVLEFDISASTMKNGVSLWGTASTLLQLRIQSGYVSADENDLSNELWIKSIEGISDPNYSTVEDSDAVQAWLTDDAAEKVQAAGEAQSDVAGWIFPKDNALVSGDATLYQKESGLLFYSEYRKQGATMILKPAEGESINLDDLTTLKLYLRNFGYGTTFDITYRNMNGRSATQTVTIDARSSEVKEYKLNMFGANNWKGILDTLMITYNSVGNDNAILFVGIEFSEFEVAQIPGFNFNDKYTFGATSTEAMDVSFAGNDEGTMVNVIDDSAAKIEKTYDVAYTNYGYSAMTLNYKMKEAGITKVIVALTINDVETAYEYAVSVEETSVTLPLEATGNIQKVTITFEGTGAIIIKNITFKLDAFTSLDFSSVELCNYITIRRKWGNALSFDGNTNSTLHSQAGVSEYSKYYFGIAKGEQDMGEGNISLNGKSKIVVVYQNTGTAMNLSIAAGFVDITEDDSWKTAGMEPYNKTSGGGATYMPLKGEMAENEWDYVEFDLLKYNNISAETINEKALAVILMEFSDASLSTSIKIRAISVI